MSDFDEFMEGGAADSFEVIGPKTVTIGKISKTAIFSPIANRRDIRDTGMWQQAETVAEFIRADFEAMALVSEAEVVVGATAGSPGQRFRVTNVDNDPHDPCVRCGLALVRA